MDGLPAVAPPGGDDLPPLPSHTRPLEHQVAGHVYGKGKTKLGFLDCGDGTIFKPLQAGGRGRCELDLYRRIFDPSCSDCTLLQLQTLVPRFLGTFVSPNQSDVSYLHLEDLAHGFSQPCVADIKMGRISYDPHASPGKRAKEEAKYPPQKLLGFQFRGMRVYNQEENTFTTYSKEQLRQYDETEILQKGFAVFFSDKGGLRKDVVAACLGEVRVILAWFERQKVYNFFASSLLFVYEGRRSENNQQHVNPIQQQQHQNQQQQHSVTTANGKHCKQCFLGESAKYDPKTNCMHGNPDSDVHVGHQPVNISICGSQSSCSADCSGSPGSLKDDRDRPADPPRVLKDDRDRPADPPQVLKDDRDRPADPPRVLKDDRDRPADPPRVLKDDRDRPTDPPRVLKDDRDRPTDPPRVLKDDRDRPADPPRVLKDDRDRPADPPRVLKDDRDRPADPPRVFKDDRDRPTDPPRVLKDDRDRPADPPRVLKDDRDRPADPPRVLKDDRDRPADPPRVLKDDRDRPADPPRVFKDDRDRPTDPPRVKVKMIDFAHVFEMGQTDDNYLWGIRNVVKLLEQLLEL